MTSLISVGPSPVSQDQRGAAGRHAGEAQHERVVRKAYDRASESWGCRCWRPTSSLVVAQHDFRLVAQADLADVLIRVAAWRGAEPGLCAVKTWSPRTSSRLQPRQRGKDLRCIHSPLRLRYVRRSTGTRLFRSERSRRGGPGCPPCIKPAKSPRFRRLDWPSLHSIVHSAKPDAANVSRAELRAWALPTGGSRHVLGAIDRRAGLPSRLTERPSESSGPSTV